MSNLTVNTQNDLLAFIKENLSNDKNLSIRGLARLCGLKHTSLIRGGAFNSEKLCQKLIENGFEAGALVKNGFDDKSSLDLLRVYPLARHILDISSANHNT